MFVQWTSHLETQRGSDRKGHITGQCVPTYTPTHKSDSRIMTCHRFHELSSNLLSRRRRRQDELQPCLRPTTTTVVTVCRSDDDDVDKDGPVRFQIERRALRDGETGGAPLLRSEVRVRLAISIVVVVVIGGGVCVWLTRTRASRRAGCFASAVSNVEQEHDE